MTEILGSLSRKEVESRVSAMIPRLYIMCRTWGCKADVCDELVQETIALALSRYNQLRNPLALETWLISILNNVHRMYWRKQGYDTSYEDITLVDDNTPDRFLESERTVQQVRQAISYLSDDHRKVLTLIDMEGMSYREVADALGLCVGTVMSRISRARESLRQVLKQILNKEHRHSSPVSSIRSVK